MVLRRFRCITDGMIGVALLGMLGGGALAFAQEPTTRAEAAHQRADLAADWLHLDPDRPGLARTTPARGRGRP